MFKKPDIQVIKIAAFLLLSLAVNRGSAQSMADIGYFGGWSYYLGEINHVSQFKATSPAYGIFYRQIFDYRYSLTAKLRYGELSGNDLNSPYDYNLQRGHSFRVSTIDAALMTEFNFLPYISTSMKYRFTPYVSAGLAYLTVLDSENLNGTLAIPFGVGLKYNLSERFSMGFEWTLYKSFTDEIDGLGDYPNNPLFEEFLNNQTAEAYRQNSLIYRNDYYAFTGFFISYKFAYRRIKCPAYNETKVYD